MSNFLKILTIFIAVGAIGGAVMLWIVLEWCIWRFVALSNIFFVLGVAETAAACYSINQSRSLKDVRT